MAAPAPSSRRSVVPTCAALLHESAGPHSRRLWAFVKRKDIGMTTFAEGRDIAASTKRVQIVMDRFGDTRHEFDAADAQAVALAEERFRELTGSGFRAAALTGDGNPGKLIRSFDAAIEQ